MTEARNTWSEIKEFVKNEGGVLLFAHPVINRQTRLYDDLWMRDDDGGDFMEEFFRHFNIEEGDFDFGRYFSGKGADPWPYVLYLFLFKRKVERPNRMPLTLGMLEKAIVLGKWDGSVIELSISDL